jgi:hypothetical protein
MSVLSAVRGGFVLCLIELVASAVLAALGYTAQRRRAG